MPDKKLSSVVSSTAAQQSIQKDDGTWREYNYETPPDAHPIYALVGRVAAEWARLEHSLDRIIWTLAYTTSVRGACLTAQMMGASPRYSAIIAQLTLRSRADLKFGTYVARVKSLSNKTHDPQEQRNRIIHDPWLVDTVLDEPAQFRAWPRKKPQFGIRNVDVTEIEETITAIKKLTTKIDGLFTEIDADVAASLKRRQPRQP